MSARELDLRVLGLISGTSADGIDAAVVRCSTRGDDVGVEVGWHDTLPYPRELRERVTAAASSADAREISALHAALGGAFAIAAAKAIERAGERVDLVASHGQTVYHLPADDGRPGFVRSTLQLGDAAFIAQRTGITCVSDFRSGDIAAGGSGAPLVPYVDWLLLRSADEGRAAINVGGIANVTLLPRAAAPGEIVAFDTGPGNALLDTAARVRGIGAFDRDGAAASQGRVDDTLLARLQTHPYFARRAPKSTGRETFDERLLESAGAIATPDLLATLAELTAWSIAGALPPHTSRAIVSGGGAHNKTLMMMLRRRLGDVVVAMSDEFGLPCDAKEAIAFAVLGFQSLRAVPANVPSATGATRPAVLGRITYGENIAQLMRAVFG